MYGKICVLQVYKLTARSATVEEEVESPGPQVYHDMVVRTKKGKVVNDYIFVIFSDDQKRQVIAKHSRHIIS